MLAFKFPKHPDSVAWYEVRFQEPLAGTPTIMLEPNAHSIIPLVIDLAGLSVDSLGVRFRIGGGSDGTAWIFDLHVVTLDGSQLVIPLRLAVADA